MLSGIFYLVACAAAPAGGIYRYAYEQGSVRQLGFTPLENASYVTASPDRQFMYAVCTIGGQGAAAAFRINRDLSLTLLNIMPTEGASACHLTTSPDGRFLFCANYRNGTIAEFALNDGALLKRTKLIQHSGRGPNVKRQDGPHAHFTSMTPDNKYLCAIDLGIDAVICYPVHPEQGLLQDQAIVHPTEPGAGPRHLAFAPDGKHAYVLTELGNTVITLAYHDGQFTHRQSVSTLPKAFAGESTAAAIRVSADQRFVVASNRGFDSVAVFRILPDATLAAHDMVLTGGKSPRDVNFLPGGRRFAAANESSDSVFFYDYDPVNGKLTPDGNVITTLPCPRCIFW